MISNISIPFLLPFIVVATSTLRVLPQILKGIDYVNMPSHFSGGLSDLIQHLLINEQSKRLGRTQNGVQGIINHRFFAGFDWEGFKAQTLTAPIQPVIPEDIKLLGKKQLDKNTFKDAEYAPESDWWPDLENLEEW